MALHSQEERPNVFSYHNHREFLKDWIAHLKKQQKKMSLREIARRAEFADGYLPMVLTGKRRLSSKALEKMLPLLKLTLSEQKFLRLLWVVSESDSIDERKETLKKMQKFSQYQENSTKEIEVYQYLVHWFYVVVRELVRVKGFSEDPKWIQSLFYQKLSQQEIKDSLDFLKAREFLKCDPNGSISQNQKPLECKEGVYKVSLGSFHKQMLTQAIRSIEEVPSQDRLIMGHTVALSQEDCEKFKKMAEDFFKTISVQAPIGEPERVYHMALNFFPITKEHVS